MRLLSLGSPIGTNSRHTVGDVLTHSLLSNHMHALFQKMSELFGCSPAYAGVKRTTQVVPLIHAGRTRHANEVDLVQYSDANWALAEPACLWRSAPQAWPMKRQDSNAHRNRTPNVYCSRALCPVYQDCQNSLRHDLLTLSLP